MEPWVSFLRQRVQDREVCFQNYELPYLTCLQCSDFLWICIRALKSHQYHCRRLRMFFWILKYWINVDRLHYQSLKDEGTLRNMAMSKKTWNQILKFWWCLKIMNKVTKCLWKADSTWMFFFSLFITTDFNTKSCWQNFVMLALFWWVVFFVQCYILCKIQKQLWMAANMCILVNNWIWCWMLLCSCCWQS